MSGPLQVRDATMAWVAHLVKCPGCSEAAKRMQPGLRCEEGQRLRTVMMDLKREWPKGVHS